MSIFEGQIFRTDDLLEKMKDLESKARKEIEDAVAAGTLAIHAEAVRSINAHMSSGATYGKHTASKPGNPPNTDTGVLVKSIEFEIDKQNLEGIVGTNLKYGVDLEFGTSKMEARPWLSRAFKVKAEEITKAFNEAVRKAFST